MIREILFSYRIICLKTLVCLESVMVEWSEDVMEQRKMANVKQTVAEGQWRCGDGVEQQTAVQMHQQ